MKIVPILKRVTAGASIIIGTVFGFLLSTTAHEHHLQYWILGFIIGFPVPWVVYLAIWFIIKGISKTPFPEQSQSIVNMVKRIFNVTLTEYQESILVDLTGTALLIAAALTVAGAAFIIITGILFIVGRLSW